MLESGYSEEDGMVKNADRTVERLIKKGDTSDMNYSGSYIGEDARNGFYIFPEVFWNSAVPPWLLPAHPRPWQKADQYKASGC